MTNAKIVNFQQLTIVKKITILPEEAKMVAYRATTTFFLNKFFRYVEVQIK